MFILKLQDRNGAELKEGDLVRIEDGYGQITFFCEVKYLEEEKAIAPFHTFAFHSIEKTDSLPPEAEPMNMEGRYKAWYLRSNDDDNEENNFKAHDKYLTSWRECEYQLNNRAFHIVRADK